MASKHSNPDGTRKHGRRQRPAEHLRYIPDDDFPLSVHLASGRYYKVVRGQRHYFGKLEDGPGPALEAWLAVRDELVSGLTPESWKRGAGVTVGDLLNEWLEAQASKAEAGDINGRTFADYHRVAKVVADVLGRITRVTDLTPDRFAKLGSRFKRDQSPTNAGKSITITKMAFSWAWQNGVIPNPVRLGTDFKMPAKAARRAASRSRGKGIYTAAQVRKLLSASSGQLHAMTLLGINGGMTQLEVSGLVPGDFDLDAGLIEMVRNKSGIRRTIPLWQETLEAVRAVIADSGGDLVFMTTRGNPWVREYVDHVPTPGNPKATTPKLRRTDSLNLEFRKLLKATGCKIEGAGFGRLRHTFSTVADELNDPNAKRRILGQELVGIDSHYVTSIGIDRLRLITDHVHRWVWPPKTRGGRK